MTAYSSIRDVVFFSENNGGLYGFHNDEVRERAIREVSGIGGWGLSE